MSNATSPSQNTPKYNIGTFAETSLHASLKSQYSKSGDLLEYPVDGYTVDVKSGDLIIEIQTKNFYQIRDKLNNLLGNYKVRIVYPIPLEKWIVKLPHESTDLVIRRKSPKRGRVEHLFGELLYIPHIALHPNLSLEVLLTKEEELRRNDGKGSWRRKGWSLVDRKLLEIVECYLFSCKADYHALLPVNLPLTFTTTELAEELSMPKSLAQKMVYSFRKMEIIALIGKRGRANLYSWSPN